MKTYPIAEDFTSIQGEGNFSGTQMHFIRLAGCTVGKPFTDSFEDRAVVARAYADAADKPAYVERCQSWDGRFFACDTNYRMKEKLTAAEIIQRVPKGIQRICITGGEPLMHDLEPLISEARSRGLDTSLETSGTIDLPVALVGRVWLTVSPKAGVKTRMLALANEVKLLVDENFQLGQVPPISDHVLVYVQPINFENDIDMINLRICLRVLEQRPRWRLSVQLHKIAKVR